MKTQDELYNEYIELISLLKQDPENDDTLDRCDEVWCAMDKETMDRVENYLENKNSK